MIVYNNLEITLTVCNSLCMNNDDYIWHSFFEVADMPDPSTKKNICILVVLSFFIGDFKMMSNYADQS